MEVVLVIIYYYDNRFSSISVAGMDTSKYRSDGRFT